jgi:hypothetical protein
MPSDDKASFGFHYPHGLSQGLVPSTEARVDFFRAKLNSPIYPSINLRTGQTLSSHTREVRRQTHTRTFVLAMLAEPLPRDHDGHRALGDQVIRKRAEDNTVRVKINGNVLIWPLVLLSTK